VSTEVQNGYGRTLLMEAAKNGHAACIAVAVVGLALLRHFAALTP
jgi:ankyrin repeat protein